jgi:orotidine-5'-phosphate decarboxylase
MGLSTFKTSINQASERLKTKIVLALDLTDRDRTTLSTRCIDILEAASPYICALKLNRPLVLRLCLDREIKDLLERAHDFGLVTIMDAKLNDVAHTNLATAVQYFDAGFDALIASPFVGWEGGLDSVFREASTRGKGVILLVHMSHKGAAEGYGQTVVDIKTGKERPQFMIFAERALAWNADGAVVGATHLEKITSTRAILQGKVPIYSPGIALQGGSAKEAVKAGADYLIVGRAICDSANPTESARSIRDEAISALESN